MVGIAWLPICMFWCHLASVGSVLKRHVSHFSSFSCKHPSSTPLISSACNDCSFLIYIYVLHTNVTAYATFCHSEHFLRINLVHSMHLTEFTSEKRTDWAVTRGECKTLSSGEATTRPSAAARTGRKTSFCGGQILWRGEWDSAAPVGLVLGLHGGEMEGLIRRESLGVGGDATQGLGATQSYF